MTNEELVALIQTGETNRLAELWNQTERFIHQQALRRASHLEGAVVDVDDLTQAGFFAVVAAAESFDPLAGCSFIGWLDFHLHTAFNQAAGMLTDRQRQDPIHHCSSLNAPLDQENGNTLADEISDPDSLTAFEAVEKEIWNQQLRNALEKTLDQIPAKQANVIRSRYFKGCTLQQAGKEIGVSIERARQIEEAGIQSLRKPTVSGVLEQYVERRTPYFLYVGLSEFHRTQTSAVEKIALLREKMRKHGVTDPAPKKGVLWTQKNG